MNREFLHDTDHRDNGGSDYVAAGCGAQHNTRTCPGAATGDCRIKTATVACYWDTGP